MGFRLAVQGLGIVDAPYGRDPIDLFKNSETGAWLDLSPSHTSSDTAGTTPAAVGEGIANANDRSPNDADSVQATSTARPILARVPRGGRRNLFDVRSLTESVWVKFGSPTITVAAISAPEAVGDADLFTEGTPTSPHGANRSYSAVAGRTYTASVYIKSNGRDTVRFGYNSNNFSPVESHHIDLTFSTGDVTIGPASSSETAYAVPLGDGWYRVVLSALHNLTRSSTINIIGVVGGAITYTGDGVSGFYVAGMQIEESSMVTPYQKVVTQYDITEAGVESIYHAVYDLTDDISPVTLPAITGGTIILFGIKGYYIQSLTYAGGTFNIGPTTYTGGAAGVIALLGGVTAALITDRALTAAERAAVIAWGVARGSADEDLNP